ncbi:MAG: LysR family transcriptional regulator [Gordonia sp. (in: high G+C Gram-positive bacteria)]|uniref:LysR family transcriptional regulator n=1 Tax=Gordonia sp. (in: high G+C Gram-positive bacteria) TaxID=84139 RepID=UPI003BB4F190
MNSESGRERKVPALDLRRLEQFVAVVECGSLTDAAAQLGVTQQALSVSIRALEEQVGVTLFTRSRGMRPSESGLRLYESAQVLLAGAHRLIPDVQDSARSQSEIVRVGYTPGLSSVDVFDVVRDGFPADAILQLQALYPRALRRQLELGKIDIAFRRGVLPPEGYASAVAGFSRLNVAVCTDVASDLDSAGIHLSELRGLSLVLWAPESRSSYAAYLLAQCRRIGFEPDVQVSRFQGLDQVAAPLAVERGFALVTADPGRHCGGRITVLPVREQMQAPIQALWLPTSRCGVVGDVVAALTARAELS